MIRPARMQKLNEVNEQFAVKEGIAFRRVQNLKDDYSRGLEITIDSASSPDTICEE